MTHKILILSLFCSALLFTTAYSVAPYEDLNALINGDSDNIVREINFSVQDGGHTKDSYGGFTEEPREVVQKNSDLSEDFNGGVIKETMLENNNSTQTIELPGCSITKIPVNKAGMKISVNNVFGAQKVMISDGLLTSCIDIAAFECPEDATFCSVEELYEQSHIELQEEIEHLDTIYLYVHPDIIGEEFAIEVKLLPIRNTEDTTTEKKEDNSVPSVSPVSPVSEIEYCGKLEKDTCQSPADDVCSSKCMWLNCKVKGDGTETQTSEGCVPAKWSNKQLQLTCETMQLYFETPVENQVIEYPICEQKPEQVIGESGSNDHIMKIVGLVFSGILFVFVVVVCYYRHQFKKYKQGPFNAPSWCPNFLFPRYSGDMHMFLPIGAKKSHDVEMDYNPPVPVL